MVQATGKMTMDNWETEPIFIRPSVQVVDVNGSPFPMLVQFPRAYAHIHYFQVGWFCMGNGPRIQMEGWVMERLQVPIQSGTGVGHSGNPFTGYHCHLRRRDAQRIPKIRWYGMGNVGR